MSIEFRKKAYNRVGRILSKSNAWVVGFGRDEFILWTINKSRLNELSTLMKDKKLVGLVVDYGKTSLCFNLNKDRVYVNKRVLSEKSILDYATEHLLVTGGHAESSLKSEIDSNNDFVYSIVDFFSKTVERVDLNKIQIKYDGNTSLPYFYSANIINKNFNLYVTKHQMSLVTKSGFVKVHDTSKDVGSDYIADLVSNLFSIDKDVLENLIHSSNVTV